MLGYERSLSNGSVFFTDVEGNPSSSTQLKNDGNFRFGANFGFRVATALMMKAGLRYASIGTTLINGDVRWPSEIGPNGWIPDPALPRSIRSTTTDRFVELPLIVRYEINHHRWQPYIESGLSVHYYHNTKTASVGLSKSTMIERVASPNLNSLQLAFVVGIGVQYAVSPDYQVYVNPTYRVHINEWNTFLGERLSTVGVEFGLRRRLATFAQD